MSYTIAGKKILNEHLVLGTFGAYGALGYYLTSGPSKPKQSAPSDGPAFGAKSADEEAFIKQFLAEAQTNSESSQKK